LLTTLCIIAIASVAWADKPVQTIDDPVFLVECAFQNVMYNWDFNEGDSGFTTALCEDGAVPTWQYGYWAEIDVNAWFTGTSEEDYHSESGHSLISPSFLVDASTYMVEVAHWYNIETSYDGGNLSVNGMVVEPMIGYPDDEISDSVNFYAWCVDGEPGFTGLSGTEVVHSCFDLSAFLGETVQLSFDFGSDSSVTYPGWAIFRVSVGSDVVPVDGTTWSAVKGMFR
jgi:hypothetical protein